MIPRQILNDDAVPEPGWLGVLIDVLERNPDVAAVQGTVVAAATGEPIAGARTSVMGSLP